jgi:hypothetical protein
MFASIGFRLKLLSFMMCEPTLLRSHCCWFMGAALIAGNAMRVAREMNRYPQMTTRKRMNTTTRLHWSKEFDHDGRGHLFIFVEG